MNKSDKQFILELVRKETIALSIAFETKITENLKREMNQFRIHLQFRINQKLMKIFDNQLFKVNRKINFYAFVYSMRHLSKTIKIRHRYNLII